jgi:hypothetical protein
MDKSIWIFGILKPIKVIIRNLHLTKQGFIRKFRPISFDKSTPGVDVMITIFCDFFPIFGEKIGVFLKSQSYD